MKFNIVARRLHGSGGILKSRWRNKFTTNFAPQTHDRPNANRVTQSFVCNSLCDFKLKFTVIEKLFLSLLRQYLHSVDYLDVWSTAHRLTGNNSRNVYLNYLIFNTFSSFPVSSFLFFLSFPRSLWKMFSVVFVCRCVCGGEKQKETAINTPRIFYEFSLLLVVYAFHAVFYVAGFRFRFSRRFLEHRQICSDTQTACVCFPIFRTFKSIIFQYIYVLCTLHNRGSSPRQFSKTDK